MENTINPGIEENGNVNIADEVVSVIASLAASEVKGVASMGGGGIAELLGKKNLSKGVKLTMNEKTVVLDLSIIVEYGTKIPEVAWELQEKVKNEVEAMTGLAVTSVNISVDGVNVPKVENEKEAPEAVAAEDLPDIEEEIEEEETTEE